jgi:hypothetical protein
MVPRQPFLFSDAMVAASPHVSDLSEDATPVLRDMLAMTEHEIDDLRQRRIIV